MGRILIVLFLLLPGFLQAQFTYVLDTRIPVMDTDGNALTMPWAGGINAAQYNTMDLNGDGKNDLVLFDRMANKVITFVNQNNTFQYASEFEALFPDNVTNFLLLRDFNCDGKKDIFTGDILGIKVYLNTTQSGENLSWKQFYFYDPQGTSKSPVLLTKGFSGMINLQLQYDDLPSISDMDGDGDLDIMNVKYASNGTVEYHQNFSKERYGTCDSLAFERITQNWGDFIECNCGKFAFYDSTCASIGGRVQHAAGKSLLTLDIDGDLDEDLLFSESTCTQLYLLQNVGSSSSPVINSYSAYPNTNPVNFLIFPGAFYEDVDFDGLKDLIVTPNIYSKAYPNLNLQSSNWFYKNTGTEQFPDFTFEKNNLLQEHMIDIGDDAVPAFADYDGDGDYDMFISQNGTENYVASIYLYENEGSPAEPQFKLITEDFQSFSLYGFYNLKIQFADMNGDNKTDLVFTATSFQTAITNFYYLPNKGTNLFDFTGQSPLRIDFTFAYAENIHVTDVNLDGFPDLLVGKNNGAVQYWKNQGIAGSIGFTLEDDSFLGLGSSLLTQNPACFVADVDGDRKADVIMGNQIGEVTIIPDFRNAVDPSGEITEIIFNNILNKNTAQDLGGRIWPTVVNLFNSDKPAIVVGNILGGVHILRNDESHSLPEEPVIEIYPVPVSKMETLNVSIDRKAFMQVFTMLGQEVGEPYLLQAYQNYAYKVANLSSGMYVLRFTVNNKSYSKRIVVH